MKRNLGPLSNLEPGIGGSRRERLSGLEPGLSREFGPLYGRFQIRGLEAPPVEGRRRPLVVVGEADFDTGQLVRLIADSNGYDVCLTDDGNDVLNKTRSNLPNLVVVNIGLVNRGGLRVIRQIRMADEVKLRDVPVLVMDVQKGKQDVRNAFAAGADDYLVMPYDLPVLLRCWQRVCGSRCRPSPMTALHSDDALIRQLALAYLIEHRPEGTYDGLNGLLAVADPSLQVMVRWALRRLGEHR